MARDLHTALRDLCSHLPECEEVISHGSPNFKVRGKSFASYHVNHHGDGRVALWLDAPDGAQQLYTEMEPEHYFVPPYVGPRGWLGVSLVSGLSWSTVCERVREAYLKAAPRALEKSVPDLSKVKPPAKLPGASDIDPFQKPKVRSVLKRLGTLCARLPETEAAEQFGSPVWKAGKKTFVGMHHHTGRLQMTFWVGPDRQAMLTYDSRYRIPAYTGHNGWIDLDVEDGVDWDEVEPLLLGSYRHFALKRMLKALETAV